MRRFPGKSVPLSAGRRLMCDMLHASRKVPLVAMERRIDLRPIRAARARCADPPSWFALTIKAFALAAQRHPPLRTTYLSFPWPRLYVHDYTVAVLPVERRIDGEDVVLFGQLWHPEETPVAAIHTQIRRLKEVPVGEEKLFRDALRLARLPRVVRRLCWWAGLEWNGYWRMVNFGTFGVTGVASLGASSLHFLSPLTCSVAVTAFEPDGTALVRLMYDHRVTDGVVPARGLADFEAILNADLRRELESLPAAATS